MHPQKSLVLLSTAVLMLAVSTAGSADTFTLPEVPVKYEEEELLLSFLFYPEPLKLDKGLLVEPVEPQPLWYQALKSHLRPDTFSGFSEWRKNFTAFPGEGYGMRDERAFGVVTAAAIKDVQSSDGPDDRRLQKLTVLHEVHVTNPSTGEKFLFLIPWKGEKESLPVSGGGGRFTFAFRWSEQKQRYEYILPDSEVMTDAAMQAYMAGGEQVVTDATLTKIMENYEGKEAGVLAAALEALRKSQ